MKNYLQKKEKKVNLVLIFALIIYSLRHITLGIDFNDTGYSLANFRYMGLEHMDSMWLFATYLANVTGHILTTLPFGKTLIGMNIYTGLFAGGMAAGAYLFFKKALRLPAGIAFAGEMLALSLCWCPTADLYNYMTYANLLICCILLYHGLINDEKNGTAGRNVIPGRTSGRMLFAAGFVLASNVFVRFANLPEAVLILAVWGYGVLERFQEKEKRAMARTLKRTGFCLTGYLTALVVWGGWIHIRYGMREYIAGIRRLFAMTDNARDYKPRAMIMAMFQEYIRELHYIVRIGFFLVVSMLIFHVIRFVLRKIGTKEKIKSVFCAAAAAAVSVGMVMWLYRDTTRFASFFYRSYDSILRPAVLFLFCTLVTAAIRILSAKAPLPEKLVGGLVILTIFVTPMGSNNGIYPSINDLFFTAPWLLWQLWKFAGFTLKNAKIIWVKNLSLFPVKCIFAALLMVVFVQAFFFGHYFVFAESTGLTDASARMTHEGVLRGVRMSPERMEIMTELLEYTEEHDLIGTDVILYGDIPSLSFYLQMPAAFNPWPNLTSYSVETFTKALVRTKEKITGSTKDESYKPVVMLEKVYAACLEELGAQRVSLSEVTGKEVLGVIMGDGAENAQPREVTASEKFAALLKFMDEYGYKKVLQNEKVTVYAME